MEKILTALSGGIDSAATVILLREHGFEPEALYLDMAGDRASRRKAAETARQLKVKLHTEDIRDEFRRRVIDQTLSEHNAGRTPSPCAVCNPQVKWRFLAGVADRLGIGLISTGHYIRITHQDGVLYVVRGVDPAKDQSYYLWGLGQEVLKRAVTPLGDFTKTEIRALLAGHGLMELAGGSESMGVCFLKDGSYRKFLEENLSDGIAPGEVVNRQGNIIGRHEGYQLYTIGQKRGFSAGSEEVHITHIDAPANRITVSDDPEELYSSVLFGEGLYAPDPGRLASEGLKVAIRGLGRNPEGACKVTPGERGAVTVELEGGRAWAAAPGQPMVFYDGDAVVGGAFLAGSKH